MNFSAYTASIRAQTLASSVPIRVRANFGPLNCTATAATLASAGARALLHEFGHGVSCRLRAGA